MLMMNLFLSKQHRNNGLRLRFHLFLLNETCCRFHTRMYVWETIHNAQAVFGSVTKSLTGEQPPFFCLLKKSFCFSLIRGMSAIITFLFSLLKQLLMAKQRLRVSEKEGKGESENLSKNRSCGKIYCKTIMGTVRSILIFTHHEEA